MIRITLGNNTNIMMATNNLKQSNARVLSSRSEFDPMLNIGVDYGKNKNPIPFGLEVLLPEQRNTNYSVGLTKKFDWGLLVNPNIQIRQSDAEFLDTREQQTQSAFNFTIIAPLLRNRGFVGTGANEKASEINYSAEKKKMSFTVSTEIRNSLNAYLDVYESTRRFEILRESERRAEKIVELTKVLIKADKRPARELDIVNANLADKKLSILLAEKDLFNAKQKLVLSLGLNYNLLEQVNIDGSLVQQGNQKFEFSKPMSDDLINMAMQNRTDYLAAVEELESISLQKTSAQRNTLNQLNLTMNIGYSGWERGSEFNQLFSNIYPKEKGLNYTIGLSYELPFLNNLKEAELISRTVDYDNSILRNEDLKRNIRSQVEIAKKNVETALLEIEYSKNAMELYKLSYESENLKQQKGLSTFFDVDITEQKLTSATQSVITAQMNYLKSILELKFAVGLLMAKSESDFSFIIDAKNLFDLQTLYQ
ncbi:MAG: TolC family protein [Melioribacteraceae bacterium]